MSYRFVVFINYNKFLSVQGELIVSDKNSKSKKLKENLFYNIKDVALESKKKNEEKIEKFSINYKDFLNKAKTEREAVKIAIEKAKQYGFEEFDPNKKYSAFDKVYYNNRDKAVILAVIGEESLESGTLISAAHIDSPRLDLKAHPLYESNSIAYFKTHYYGGIKKYQWPVMPLSLHGVVVKKDGEVVDINIGEDDNDEKFCISDLLPHLANEQMQKPLGKAIKGEDLNVLVGNIPYDYESGEDLVKLNVMKILNDKYAIKEDDFISAELSFVPAYKASDIGFDRSMIGSYGHDDRVCAYCALEAIFNCKKPKKTVITVLADKEEVGSDGNTGLNSNYMMYFISDLAKSEGLDVNHVLSRSMCLSADVNAAFDPGFASEFDPNNSSYMGLGTVITKYTGHGGKYSTSDASAELMAKFRNIMDSNDVIWQTGELGKTDSGGGGTVAKYIANLNIDVVDLGVPVMSMHSPFEIISKFDLYMTYKAIKSFFMS